MIFGFDDDKNKVEVLKVIDHEFVAEVSGSYNEFISFPDGFNLNNSVIISVAIKVGNQSQFFYEPSALINAIFQEPTGVEIELQNLTRNNYYTIRLALARTS